VAVPTPDAHANRVAAASSATEREGTARSDERGTFGGDGMRSDRVEKSAAAGSAEHPAKSDTPERAGRARRALRGAGITASALVVVAFGALVHRIADAARGAHIEQVASSEDLPSPHDPRFGEIVALAADFELTGASTVELLVDTAVFGRLLDDIEAAREHVTFFIYFCEPGTLGDRFTRALVAAARRGVRVLFLGDDFACGDYVDELRDPLGEAGGRAEALRPVRWHSLHRAQHRNHARSVVIDGRVGYTGGFGIADAWFGEDGGAPWRETSVRVTGPVVDRLQAAFLTSWAEATGAIEVDGALLEPALREPPSNRSAASGSSATSAAPPASDASPGEAPSPTAVGLLVSRPGVGPTAAERYFALTVAGARERLYVASAYFVPTGPERRLLVDAARRGVDVRVLVPGPTIDVPSTKWAGRAYFEELLQAGVRLFEYQPAMMHAKTLVADGVWSTVGSLNVDGRSMRLNEEWSLVVHGPELGAMMDSLFLVDLERSREITLERHRARPLTERLRELAVRLVTPFL
jgi:cardiolipin synthase A/B